MAAREREYDDDDDRPRPKRRPPGDEFEEGEPPPRRRPRDEFEDDDRPVRKARSRDDDFDEDDDYDDRPRRKRRRRRDVDEEYAGFGARLVAVIIDGILLNIVLLPLRLIVPGIGFTDPNPNMGMLTVFSVVSILINWFYEAGMISSSWQATLGGKAMRIKVTDLDGRPIGFAQSTGRFFAKLLSSLICLIGFLMQPFTERKQALHDMIAGTLVVRDDR